MKTETDRLWPALYHGWVELLTLFLVLFTVLSCWGWARNRGFRPAERMGPTPWLLLFIAYGLLLLVRSFDGDVVRTAIIGGSLLIGGWISKAVHERQLWFPAVLLATLMGSGFMLSALVLAAVGFIVLLIGAKRP